MLFSPENNFIMQKIFLIIVCFILSGCTVVSVESGIAESKKVYSIDCSGGLNTMSSCYKEAESLCPIGYEKLSERKPEPEIFFLTNPGIITQTQTSPTINRKLTLRCNSPEIKKELSPDDNTNKF